MESVKKERWLVCGGRDYRDEATLHKVLNTLTAIRGYPEVVIHGDANGADRLAGWWGLSAELDVLVFPADWKTDGPRAGPLRNQRMIDDGQPTLVIAFPGGTGTADMSRRAVRAGIELIEVRKDGTWNP